MTEAAWHQALEEGKRRLREFLEASDAGRQAMAMSGVKGDEYEMSNFNGKLAGRPSDRGGEDDDGDLS
jgi:hypothetical protein